VLYGRDLGIPLPHKAGSWWRGRRVAFSAHAIGYPVIRHRYLATLSEAQLAGVRALVSLVYTALGTEGVIAGRLDRGALVVFRGPGGQAGVWGAYLFAGNMAQLSPTRGQRPATELCGACPISATSSFSPSFLDTRR